MAYSVWRRNDGGVGVSAIGLPASWTGADGSVHTFVELGSYKDWDAAYARILAERKQQTTYSGLPPAKICAVGDF
jgi:hypothetical protein